MRKLFLLLFLTLLSALGMAQATFVQTTSEDFIKGTTIGVNIADGSISLQGKMQSLNDWTSTTNLPQVMEGHQITMCRNYVYLIGGTNGTTVLNNVYVATQQTNGISGWTSLNALPVALRDMAVVATQTHLYVMGGRNNDGVSNKIYSAQINDNGTIGEWSELTITLPNPRWGARAITTLDFIYVVGGASADNDNSVSNSVYRMTLNAFGEITGVTAMTTMPQALNGHAVAVYDSKIIVTGGYNSSHQPTNTVYTAEVGLDGTLGSWQTQTALPTALCDHNMVVTNGIIGVFGGYDGNLPCNALYIADASQAQYSWTLSDIVLIERNTKATAFTFGEKIFYSGGESLSGSLNNYIRFARINTSSQMVNKSMFVSCPFYIGTPKNMQQLDYTLNLLGSGTTYEVLYRTADENGVFSTWISATSNNPVMLNQTKSHIQYMFRFTATGSGNVSLDDVTLTVSGYTLLAGSLNDVETLTLAGSPYWVTDNISFTSGTHTIEAGVTMLFSPNTGLNIGRANMSFNGTSENPITLTYQGTENGLWNGVYFEDYSDYGVSSTMSYTIIEKAGNGDNNANLRLYYTNSPTIDHCTFRNAEGHGVRMVYSSPTISNSSITGNTECGLYLEGSGPTCTDNMMNGNEYGLYIANNYNNSIPILSGITLSDNTFGFYSYTPDRSFTYDGTDVDFLNNGTDIAVGSGRVSEDRTWNYYANGYALFGNLEVYGGTPKLTIAPGNTIKARPGCGIYVGNGSNQGGMLYAVGNQTSPITFTSYNGEIGGWEGLKFRDGSDYSSSSSLRYCVVEKANTNVWCQNTTQPSMMYCTVKDAVNSDFELNSSDITIESTDIKNARYGMYLNSSKPTLILDVFDNLSEGCVWETNTLAAEVTFYSCTMKNSNFGIRYHTPNQDIATQTNITFQNNYADEVIPGGDINENRVWGANVYYVQGGVRVGGPGQVCRLTLSLGSTLKFGENVGMEISWPYKYHPYSYYGELNAIGTSSNPITFTSMNGQPGGWNGLYFQDISDNIEGMESVLKYCVFENGNSYNVQLNNSEQPSVIENCIFRNSVGYGLYFCDGGGTVTVSDCQFQNNGSYAVYCNTPHHVGNYLNNTFTGNLNDGVVMGGGDITANRTWNAMGNNAYYILGNVNIGSGGSPVVRLTLNPGCILKFAENVTLYISNGRYGELNAVGTSSNPITFTSINGQVGGWNGLYFCDRCDDIEGQESVLKYCVIEKGNEYSMRVDNTQQPSLIENCTFRNSAGYGLYFCNGGFNVTTNSCIFQNNVGYPVYYNSPHYVGSYSNNTFSGNLKDGVVMAGGNITDDRTWNALGDYAYYILSTIKVGKEGGLCRLTLMPNCVLKFAENAAMEISQTYYSAGDHNFFGELNAVGTSTNPILFTSINGLSGGWRGLYFHTFCDQNTGMESDLKYCVFEKGNEYNVQVNGSEQPSLIEHCTFKNSVGYGLYFNNGGGTVTVKDCNFQNNDGYPVYCNTPHYVGTYLNNSFIDNLKDGVVMGGGNITDDRTWNSLGDYAYYILSTVKVGKEGGLCRLTLMPNCVLKFAENAGLEISQYYYSYGGHNLYGELNAVGTLSSPIVFTSINGESGGWSGLYFQDNSDNTNGMESVLKYCNILNGNGYSLRVDDSNQPYLVEHCKLLNSNGRGLWLQNSSIEVNKSLIRNNASYGIYLSGNSAPTIGGSMMKGCDILENNNGGYAIYQDGSQDVNMSYNYFGVFDVNYIDDNLVYDKKENSGKGRITIDPVSQTPRSIGSTWLRGNLYYDNSTPMYNTTISVKDYHNNTLAETTTSSGGQAYFNLGDVDLNVAAKLVITPTNGMSGVNSTDALAVMRHFAHLTTLTDAHLKVADVNGSNTVNGTDALFIQRRYTNAISDFPVGSYYLNIADLDFDGNEADMRLNFLWYGDVNGNAMGLRENEVTLQNEGELLAESNQQIIVPVSVKDMLSVGATSLLFTYPEEYLEIEGVNIASDGSGVIYHAEDGQLFISWCSLEPLVLGNGDALLNITMKTKDLGNLNEPIQFGLGSESELADGEGNVIENVTLLMPSVVTEMFAVAENKTDDGLFLKAYPNPMNDHVTISYYLESDEAVTMTVVNTKGSTVARLVDGFQESGKHEVTFNRNDLVSGVYNCRMTCGDRVKVIKLVVE